MSNAEPDATPDAKPKRRRRRHDPRSRFLEQSGDLTAVINRDPNYHYVLASQNKTSIRDDRYYSAIGYEPVLASNAPKAERLFVGDTAREGEAIEYQGHVLMRIPKEDFDDIERYGLHGNGGLERADRIAKAIHNRAGITQSGDVGNGMSLSTQVETKVSQVHRGQ